MRISEHRNVTIGARKLPTANGQQEVFEVSFIDKNTQDVDLVRFGVEIRDAIVRELTGGIILAGGDLPKL